MKLPSLYVAAFTQHVDEVFHSIPLQEGDSMHVEGWASLTCTVLQIVPSSPTSDMHICGQLIELHRTQRIAVAAHHLSGILHYAVSLHGISLPVESAITMPLQRIVSNERETDPIRAIPL